jgi:hypothetical protein
MPSHCPTLDYEHGVACMAAEPAIGEVGYRTIANNIKGVAPLGITNTTSSVGIETAVDECHIATRPVDGASLQMERKCAQLLCCVEPMGCALQALTYEVATFS